MRSWLLSNGLILLGGGGFITSISAQATTTSSDLSPTHSPGVCSIRGSCGKEGFFGPELPCLDNSPATSLESDAFREKLITICGQGWSDVDKVCCLEQQLDDLSGNLKRADSMIAGCPACRANFVELFCRFTCSPDQSMHVNVTKVSPAKSDPKKFMITELDYLVDDEFGNGFYDSCKEVKFGGSNGRAMDLIGGGAKNFTQFLKFLGDKKFLGSPFQMNFPRPNTSEGEDWPTGMEPMNQPTKLCNDSDPAYRCACVDCPGSCSELPAVQGEKQCFVGVLPCLSFAVIIIYSVGLTLVVLGVTGRIAWQRRTALKHERLRLLQDSAPSDDEEEVDDDETDEDGPGGLYLLRGVNGGVSTRQQRHYTLNAICDRAFGYLGRICAEFPGLTITVSLIVVFLLSLGWLRFSVEKDPVRLWVSPNSDAALEKAFFDQNFGPFFRAEQAFLVNDTAVSENGTVLSYDTLAWWFELESKIDNLKSPSGVGLNDVCFKPVGDACVVQSITGYFQGDIRNMPKSSWAEDLQACATTPVSCLPRFQQPLNPKMLLGSYDGNVLDSKALIATWVVNNHPEGSEEESKAMDFENALKEIFKDAQVEAKKRGLRLSFSTEVSLEQELNKSTNTDAKIVVISYVVMFLYASMALGSTALNLRSIMSDPASALVQSKFMLGISGIVIVLMSVSASVGLFSAFGVKVTLIIAEVIPFLVLAVGVDNIFLIVHEFERVNLNYPEGTIPARMSKALGRMGPSILLSATTETVAFALGAAVGMPAVRNFATYAAGAVFINAVLQVTMFVSVLALNQRRVEDGRADCVPCIQVVSPNSNAHGLVYGLGMEDESTLQRFIRKTYAPSLLDKRVKIGVVTFFLGLFAAGLALVPNMKLGLDQRIALPSDSYLIPYFDDLDAHFGVGAPVYFVTRELNITDQSHQRQVCARFGACDPYSLATTLELERRRPNVSYIADATASWIDDYFSWLNPLLADCCVDPKTQEPCFESRQPAWNPALKGMPEGEEFITYLQKWLKAPTSAECPLAGQAAYGNAVVVDDVRLTINASHFRTSHTPLRSQDDFISAYKAARRIAKEISESNDNIDVFPYSKFYIFFDQYVSIVSLSTALLLSGLAAVFILSTLLLGSIRTAIVVTITVGQTLVCILGAMVVAGVSLNAVSLVNLVISLGIALEFCAHVARAFTFPSGNIIERAPRSIISPHKSSQLQNGHNRQHSASSFSYNRTASGGSASTSTAHLNYLGTRGRSRDVRAWSALVNVGASVFSGITITKILGVTVLAFTRSKIFEVYYFRVWAALVIMGAAHALVWLPVALSIMGGRGYVDPESEGGLEQDLRNRRYPALLADDEYDSDYE